MKIKSVQIKIWGELVGLVSMDSSGSVAFQYDPNFKKQNWELAPLKLPLVDTPFTFPDLQKNENIELDTFKGLPGLLADSLHVGARLQRVPFFIQSTPTPNTSFSLNSNPFFFA